MTDKLREAAQEALKVLEQLQGGCTDSDDGTVEVITVWCPEVIDTLRAALAQQDAQAVPHGWKLVPVEPTTEMLQAAHDEICDGGLSTTIWLRATCYRAMLNAAPTPPEQRVMLTEAQKTKAELWDLAVGKGIITIHSEQLAPGTWSAHLSVASWMEGHDKACDISNQAYDKAIQEKQS